MSYSRRVDRNHPSCLIFLIDQSDSMLDPIAGNQRLSKAQAVAEMLNGLIYELILRSMKNPTEGPRPYFAIAVVGYGTDPRGEPKVTNALAPIDPNDVVWVPDLASRPLRVDRRPAPSGTGDVAAPVWVEPVTSGGTPMCGALDRAGMIAAQWLTSYPSSFPPIVINLTDGESTDGDPLPWANRLRTLGSTDGALLLFNLNISSDASAPLLFPSRPDQVLGAEAHSLFAMSSELPSFMVEAARAKGYSVDPGARGFGFNADMRSVMTFLNVGTDVGRALR